MLKGSIRLAAHKAGVGANAAASGQNYFVKGFRAYLMDNEKRNNSTTVLL
jgi:hypothetical protein